jgi:hypothetical protein
MSEHDEQDRLTLEERLGALTRPTYYHRDGTPIVSNELMPDSMQWALLFEESKERVVGNTKTLYGERLSTVFLGLDHNFLSVGPPVIFETMLFAPNASGKLRIKNLLGGSELTASEREECKLAEERIAKHYPHDQLQLRYSTEREAMDMHEQLKLHCLIPPRWRRFLLGTVGGFDMWKQYEDQEDDE